LLAVGPAGPHLRAAIETLAQRKIIDASQRISSQTIVDFAGVDALRADVYSEVDGFRQRTDVQVYAPKPTSLQNRKKSKKSRKTKKRKASELHYTSASSYPLALSFSTAVASSDTDNLAPAPIMRTSARLAGKKARTS